MASRGVVFVSGCGCRARHRWLHHLHELANGSAGAAPATPVPTGRHLPPRPDPRRRRSPLRSRGRLRHRRRSGCLLGPNMVGDAGRAGAATEGRSAEHAEQASGSDAGGGNGGARRAFVPMRLPPIGSGRDRAGIGGCAPRATGRSHLFRGYIHPVETSVGEIEPSRNDFRDSESGSATRAGPFSFKTKSHADGFTFRVPRQRLRALRPAARRRTGAQACVHREPRAPAVEQPTSSFCPKNAPVAQPGSQARAPALR